MYLRFGNFTEIWERHHERYLKTTHMTRKYLLSNKNNLKLSLSAVIGEFNTLFSFWWSNLLKWFFSDKICTGTYSDKQLLLHWGNLTDQPNWSIKPGVHASLHPNCHSFNLNIHYSPPFQRLIWDYRKTDSTRIKKNLNMVN